MSYKSFISLCMFFCFSSCVTPIQIRKGPSLSPSKVSQKKWTKTQHAFLWGLISPAPIRAYSICKSSSWQSVAIERSLNHVIVSFLTLGFYVPVGVTVVCLPLEPLGHSSDEFKEFETPKDKNSGPTHELPL